MHDKITLGISSIMKGKARQMYKLEMHCHHREISACATCSADELIMRYRAAGYSGIVSTNHLNGATKLGSDSGTWKEKARYFFHGIEMLKKAAGEGFDVLPGCEVNLTPKNWPVFLPNDYLIYGITEEWLISAGDVREMTLDRLCACAREAGLPIIQAHPFRCGTVLMNPDLLDGYETYNGSRHQSYNGLAETWARMNGKIMTSGSDFHYTGDTPSGGILTSERIRHRDDLIKTLFSGNYQLLGGVSADECC